MLLKNWVSICRRLKLHPVFHPVPKTNSKWIKDLNIRPETLKATGSSRKYTGTDRHRERLPKKNSKGSTSKGKNEKMGLH
jgi:hypothetical protein